MIVRDALRARAASPLCTRAHARPSRPYLHRDFGLLPRMDGPTTHKSSQQTSHQVKLRGTYQKLSVCRSLLRDLMQASPDEVLGVLLESLGKLRRVSMDDRRQLRKDVRVCLRWIRIPPRCHLDHREPERPHIRGDRVSADVIL